MMKPRKPRKNERKASLPKRVYFLHSRSPPPYLFFHCFLFRCATQSFGSLLVKITTEFYFLVMVVQRHRSALACDFSLLHARLFRSSVSSITSTSRFNTSTSSLDDGFRELAAASAEAELTALHHHLSQEVLQWFRRIKNTAGTADTPNEVTTSTSGVHVHVRFFPQPLVATAISVRSNGAPAAAAVESSSGGAAFFAEIIIRDAAVMRQSLVLAAHQRAQDAHRILHVRAYPPSGALKNESATASRKRTRGGIRTSMTEHTDVNILAPRDQTAASGSSTRIIGSLPSSEAITPGHSNLLEGYLQRQQEQQLNAGGKRRGVVQSADDGLLFVAYLAISGWYYGFDSPQQLILDAEPSRLDDSAPAATVTGSAIPEPSAAPGRPRPSLFVVRCATGGFVQSTILS